MLVAPDAAKPARGCGHANAHGCDHGYDRGRGYGYGCGNDPSGMLYYNITSLYKALRGLAFRAVRFQVSWRTSARPANRPSIENTTEPST